MIQSSTVLTGDSKPLDDSAHLTPEELACVQAAMAAGMDAFTVPTPGDDMGMIDWRVGTMVAMRDKAVVSYLFAYQATKTHFKVVGPEVTLGTKTPKGLQKRA